MAGAGTVVLLLGIITTTSWARSTATRTATRLMPESEKVTVRTR
jgi:hypothetical protein